MENLNVMAPLLGGVMIGVAATVMLLFTGRIAGNSGIIGGLFSFKKDKACWRVFYVVGLMLGALIYKWIKQGEVPIEINATVPSLIIAGLLVGFGTRLGSGCTSGHGICGIARCSKRSITATLIFMGTAMATVYIIKILSGGAL